MVRIVGPHHLPTYCLVANRAGATGTLSGSNRQEARWRGYKDIVVVYVTSISTTLILY